MTLSLGLNSSSAKKLKQECFMEKDSLMSVNTCDTDSFDGTSHITENKASVDNGCFDYPFDEITCSNDSLNFLENIDENELSDCLYSDLPEIGNFDAVDMMFRSSDSTFGFEASNEYGSNCVSNDRFIHKEQQVNDNEEQFKVHNKSNLNQFKVTTDELGMPGKRSSLSGTFSEARRVNQDSSAELGSRNVQPITKGSGSAADINLGASSFCQLQLVMEQLDSKTKICMKDNLYRLARGAEQRHKHVSLNGDCEDKTDNNGTRGVKRKTEYTSSMGVETDANSVDRSIAHLLFYTASKSSAVGA